MRLTFLLFLTLLMLPHSGLAQSDPLGLTGKRVRLTSPELGARKQTGTVVEVRSDTLLFTADNQSTSAFVRAGSLTGLEVSRGRRSHVAAGLGIGLLVGVLGGAAIAGATDTSNNEESGLAVLAGGLVGAGVGLAAGAVLGSLIHTDRWDPLRLPIHVGLLPGAHALGVAVTYRGVTHH
jgi:MFS family permease